MKIAIDPVAKPRMTQSDKWNKRDCVLRYRAFADELRLRAGTSRKGWKDALSFRFVLPMPLSWSELKRRAHDGQAHRQKPDIDNLVKAVLDALMAEDAGVWRIAAEKRWGRAGAIEIEALPDPGA